MSWGWDDIAGDVWDSISNPGGHLQKRINQWSGADDTKKAAAEQRGYTDRALATTQDYNARAQGLLGPYMAGGAQNYADFSNMVRGNVFQPAMQQYNGPTQAGNQFMPQYQQYGGPGQTPDFNPAFQSPQFQQYQGAAGYQAQARPERQAATAENVNMYMDPGYQFRLKQGVGAVENSAANRGLLRSSGTADRINETAQGIASQEFGNAYNRFQNAQNQQHGDFESDRNFGQGNFQDARNFGYGMNQDANSWRMAAAGQQNNFNQQNADRGLMSFNNDRNFGYGMNQDFNNWNSANADRGYGQFNADRNFLYGMNQDQNNWNRTGAMNNYNMWNGLVGQGYNAAQTGANLYSDAGRQYADILMGQGNAAAAAGMAQGNQRGGLISQGFGLLGGLIGGG